MNLRLDRNARTGARRSSAGCRLSATWQEESIKIPSGGLALAASIAILAMAVAALAAGQTAAQANAAAAAPTNDIAREAMIEDTVANVVTKPSQGMSACAHAILTTQTGTVDAHVRNYAMRGPVPCRSQGENGSRWPPS